MKLATIIGIILLIGMAFGFFLISLTDVSARTLEEQYDYQGDNARFKVNYSLFDSENFTGTRANFTTNLTVQDTGFFSKIGSLINKVSQIFAREITVTDRIYLDANQEHWISSNASEVYNGDGLSEETFFLFHNESHSEGTIGFILATVNRTMIWAQVGKNNSAGGLGNSWMILPNNLSLGFLNDDGRVNMTSLTDCVLAISSLGQTVRIACDTLDTGADLFVQDDIQLGGKLFTREGIRSEGDVEFFMEGFDFDIFNGSIHVRTPRLETIGREVGDNVTFFDNDFNDGTLQNFVQITSTPVITREWTVVSSVNCLDDQCPRSQGGNAATERIMEANISTMNFNLMVLNFSLSTVNIESPDLLNVTVNNNVGSGDVQVFAISSVTAIQNVSVSLPSSMDNRSVVSLRYIFSATITNEEAYADEIMLTGFSNASTTMEIIRLDTEILLGDGSQRIFWNDSVKTLELPGNVSFVNVVEVNLTITDSITLDGITITNWNQTAINIFNQDLNITSLVKFAEVNITGNLNVSGDLIANPYLIGADGEMSLTRNGNDLTLEFELSDADTNTFIIQAGAEQFATIGAGSTGGLPGDSDWGSSGGNTLITGQGFASGFWNVDNGINFNSTPTDVEVAMRISQFNVNNQVLKIEGGTATTITSPLSIVNDNTNLFLPTRLLDVRGAANFSSTIYINNGTDVSTIGGSANETNRMQNITTYNCPANQVATGFQDNGTIICTANNPFDQTLNIGDSVTFDTVELVGIDFLPDADQVLFNDGKDFWIDISQADENLGTLFIVDGGDNILSYGSQTRSGGVKDLDLGSGVGTTMNLLAGNTNASGGWNFTDYISCTLKTDGTGNMLCGTDNAGVSGNIFNQDLNTTNFVEFFQVNATNWDNVSITETQVNDLVHTGNETVRMQNLTTYGCQGTNKVKSIANNGTVECGVDVDTISDFNLADFQASFNLNQTNIFDQVLNISSSVSFSNLDITGNAFSLGDGSAGDPTITFDSGNDGTIKWEEDGQDFEMNGDLDLTGVLRALGSQSRFGTLDSIAGNVRALAAGSGNTGGALQVDTNAAHDTTISAFFFQAFQDDLFIGPNTDADALEYDGGTDIWRFNNPNGVISAGSIGTTAQTMNLGSGDTTFVLTSNVVVLTGFGGTNTLATITGAKSGQLLTIIFVDGLVTLTDNDAHTANTFDLTGDITGADDAVIQLIFDGISWYQVSAVSTN